MSHFKALLLTVLSVVIPFSGFYYFHKVRLGISFLAGISIWLFLYYRWVHISPYYFVFMFAGLVVILATSWTLIYKLARNTTSGSIKLLIPGAIFTLVLFLIISTLIAPYMFVVPADGLSPNIIKGDRIILENNPEQFNVSDHIVYLAEYKGVMIYRIGQIEEKLGNDVFTVVYNSEPKKIDLVYVPKIIGRARYILFSKGIDSFKIHWDHFFKSL